MTRMPPAKTSYIHVPSPLRGEGRVRGEASQSCSVTTLHSTPTLALPLPGGGKGGGCDACHFVRRSNHQRGFALVAAIFIVVVLALLGIMMVTIGGMQRATASAATQGTRAYYAARTGIEWGVFQALAASGCVPGAFALTGPGLDGFNVNVTCTSTLHHEGAALDPDYRVFFITSTATSGNFGAADYVSRTIRITATNAPLP